MECALLVMIVQVLVDGCDVKDMNLRCLRDRVGLVSQEPVLFSSSVRDNICYGNPDATQQQVEAAAQAANAHSFIQKLPEGYSTQVQLLRVMRILAASCRALLTATSRICLSIYGHIQRSVHGQRSLASCVALW